MRSSIVVVTFNFRHGIRRCLEAVLADLGEDDELIVVDNASLDGTADAIAESFPMVRLVRSEMNLGYGRGCNLGASLSQAEYLVFLNQDTEVRPGWLTALLSALANTPRAGLATPKLLLAASPGLIDAVGHTVHISGLATCRGWGEPSDRYSTIEEVAAVSGACFAIRRDLFDELRGFDPRLFMYYEDDDLSLRARLLGYRCIVVPSSLALHDHTPSFSASKLRLLERNRCWTLLKLLEVRTLMALLPVLAAGEVLAWGMALLQGPWHLLAKARAWLDVLTWLADLPGERVQVQRVISDRELLRLHGSRLSFSQVTSSSLARPAEALTGFAFAGGQALASRLAAHD